MEIRNVEWPAERDAILDHIRVVHGPADGDVLGKWYGTMPRFDPADCFVIPGEQGEIAAHTMLIPRFIHFGESVVQASEIGVVGTLEKYRKQGYASALMERALERMTERGDGVSIVFGIPNFYERWGYEYGLGLYLTSYESTIDTQLALKAGTWDLTHSHQRRMSSWLGLRNRELMVRPFALDDLPAVMNLYAQSAARGHAVMARDEAIWQWQINYMEDIGRADKTSFLVAEADDTLLGYIRMVTNTPVNWFREDASRFSVVEFAGDDPDATEALFAEAAACARDFDAERIGLYVHPHSTLMKHALVHGACLRSLTGAGFIRLNDLALTAESMIGTFQSRLDQSPYSGRKVRIRIAVENQSAELMIGTIGGKDLTVELEAPATDLIRLFTGWFGLSNLTPGSFSAKDKEVLNVLFPRGDPRVGIADLI